ncbi:hypothetical protein STVA_38980 [Allostella vacuolata]|nr:hypothetical protein STVA_38980 [Stella vacuolata]
MSKIVLCRPQGGLNDMLCQIEHCCRYAERWGRTVIVDANHGRSPHLQMRFGDYFVSRQARLALDPERFPGTIDASSVFPEFLANRLYDYQTDYLVPPGARGRRTCEATTGLAITFDFSRDYPHATLVHHQVGGGFVSLFALLRLRLRDDLADELLRRWRAIGGGYHAIHVRATDYRTRYDAVLERLARSDIPRLFVATDSRQVLDDFRAALGADRVHSFARFLSETGAPMHRTPVPHEDADAKNRDAILDLLMLALAKHLIILEIEPNTSNAKYSGFSMLAQRLGETKPVLRRVIDRLDFQIGLD